MIYEFVPGDLHELFVAVLLIDGGELGLGGRDQERGQDLHRGQQLINVVPGHDHVTVFDVKLCSKQMINKLNDVVCTHGCIFF